MTIRRLGAALVTRRQLPGVLALRFGHGLLSTLERVVQAELEPIGRIAKRMEPAASASRGRHFGFLERRDLPHPQATLLRIGPLDRVGPAIGIAVGRRRLVGRTGRDGRRNQSLSAVPSPFGRGLLSGVLSPFERGCYPRSLSLRERVAIRGPLSLRERVANSAVPSPFGRGLLSAVPSPLGEG